MTEQTLVSSLSAVITLAIGYFFFYVVWQRYVVDVTRQHLFELRDQLFDIAADGRLSFENDPYKTIRRVFNAGIRFAHQADWVHILAFYLVARRRKGAIFKSAMQIPHLVAQIRDEKVRAEVQRIIGRMHLVLVWHVYRRSLVLIPLGLLVPLAAVFSTLSIKVLTRAPHRIEMLINARAVSAL
ncbi:MAG: hypothetical protein ACYDHM_01565 [Acidiferrobacterales bacterium]